MLDLIIRGGDVVTPQGVVQGDVAVAGETIAAIAAADVLSAETAKHAINAKGHIVQKPWRWEIYCAGKSAPVERSPVFFESMAEAAKEGKKALAHFLAKRAA
jgi:predicted amidohydrolase